MAGPDVYAQPRLITDLRDCDFYHTVDLPGHGCIRGPWDLRRGIDRYLSYAHFSGKRVLDVGSASGFLSFHMEKLGAEVLSYDLSAVDGRWDVVPFAGSNLPEAFRALRQSLHRIQNSYWFCHRAFASRARVVYGSVYDISPAVGPVDVATCGSILLHLRDPFLALQNVCQFVGETVIVADMIPRRQFLLWGLARCLGPRLTSLFQKQMRFLPDYRTHQSAGTWWYLTPAVIRQFLGVLGFEDTRVSYHQQYFEGTSRLMYTVVGRRTRPAPVLADRPAALAAA